MYIQNFTFINSIVIDRKIAHNFFKRHMSRFILFKFFRYTSQTNMSKKVYIFIIDFKLIDFFSLTNK